MISAETRLLPQKFAHALRLPIESAFTPGEPVQGSIAQSFGKVQRFKKCRNIIRRARKGAPEAVIAVCGCYAQTDPETVAALGVDVVAGSAGRMAFLDRLEEQLRERRPQVVEVDKALSRRRFERLPAGGREGRTRAMLKIEDGCVNSPQKPLRWVFAGPPLRAGAPARGHP